MRPYPVIARDKVLEIGYKGHVRWQSRLTDGIVQAPMVIDQFHLFPTFYLKLPPLEMIKDTDTLQQKAYKRNNSPTAEGMDWELCTITPEAKIQLTYDTARTGNKRVYLEQAHIYTVCTPPKPFEFFTFVDWRISPVVKYPIPTHQRENAIKAAMIFLQQMQYTMDAYMLYWDVEGRPPVSQLEREEVLIKYGNAACGRPPE